MVKADTIRLKNGNEVSGTIEQITEDVVYLRIPGGRISYGLDEIEAIQSDDKRFDGARSLMRVEGTRTLEAVIKSFESIAPLSEAKQAEVQALLEELRAQDSEPEYTGFNAERQRIVAQLGSYGVQAAPVLYQAYLDAHIDTAPFVLAALVTADPDRGSRIAEYELAYLKEPTVREVAAQVLARYPDANASAIEFALHDEEGVVRRGAALGLGESGSREHLPELARLIATDFDHIQEATTASVARITGQSFDSPEAALTWLRSQGLAPDLPAPQEAPAIAAEGEPAEVAAPSEPPQAAEATTQP